MSVSKEAVEAAARAMFAKGRKGDDVPSWEAATDEMKAWISGIAEAA